MSVTKAGSRRPQLRVHQQRPAPPGDLPRRRGRDHGRRRRRQRPPQRRQQHPGQLQRGHHRLRPGRHGRQARRPRRQPLLLVGRLRQGRHVRRLQQLRRRRRHHRPGQMHLVDDPGRAYAYMSGTSMAAPTVTGAVALYKASRPERDAGRGPRGAPLPRQPRTGRPATDPDATHEPLLDVSRIGPLGTFDLAPAARRSTDRRGRHDCVVPVTVDAQRDVLRAGPALGHVAAGRLDRRRSRRRA